MAERGLGNLALVIALLVTPTALALSWYYITGDPTIRPLGLSKESIRAHFGSDSGSEIQAHVSWDPLRGNEFTRAELARAVENAFAAKGHDVYVVHRDVPGLGRTQITYTVGPSHFGPYPRIRASDGINPAIAAYRMSHPHQPALLGR